MVLIFRVVLLVATAAAIILVAGRLRRLARGARPSTGRLLNEWVWTLMPLLVMGALIWRALSIK